MRGHWFDINVKVEEWDQKLNGFSDVKNIGNMDRKKED